MNILFYPFNIYFYQNLKKAFYTKCYLFLQCVILSLDTYTAATWKMKLLILSEYLKKLHLDS